MKLHWTTRIYAPLVVACGLTLAMVACRSPEPADARATAYGAELAACTAQSATREASETCEDGVRARYGRPARPGRDGGQ